MSRLLIRPPAPFYPSKENIMKRKEILPKWIRFFSWIYLLGAITPLFLLLLLFGGEVSMMMFGLEFEGTTVQPLAVLIVILATLAASVAYGILWGKDWAIRLGILYGYIAMVACIASFFIRFQSGELYIAVEPLILIPFILKLKKSIGVWEDFNPERAEIDSSLPTEPSVPQRRSFRKE